MTPATKKPVAILIGGSKPSVTSNDIFDVGLLIAIDEFREQVVAALDTYYASQPRQADEPGLDYGTR